VLVQFGDAKIDNLYDFTCALRAHKPGNKVMVTANLLALDSLLFSFNHSIARSPYS
jgi:hypothetical protein